MVGVPGIRVAAVVPLPAELGGAGEVLLVSAFGGAKLPAGQPAPGESLYAAAARIVRQVTGAQVSAERLVYLLERAGRELVFVVLCSLIGDAGDSADRAGVRFVSLAASRDDFDPAALRDLIVEDAPAGFVRPLAHVLLTGTEFGTEDVRVTW